MLKRKTKYILMALAVSSILWHPTVKALELNKETTDLHKTWNIKFNQNIDLDEESKSSIKLLDSKGNIINTNIRYGDDKTIVLEAPKDGYKENETYTISIGNKVHSKNNRYLNKGINYNFKVKKVQDNTDTKDKYKEEIDNAINLGVNKILKDGVSDDWQAIAVTRQGSTVPPNYLKAIKSKITSSKGDIGQPTDYERTALGLLSIGKDPSNFEGYNLIEKIYNNKDMEEQGINAYIFALVALDAGKFNVPDNALWTRENLIKSILDNRTSDKGWDYAGYKADPDMTGMAIAALAPYKDKNDVKIAIKEGVDKLSAMQNKNGGFSSWGTENSESSSQVIIGLCANGIDPTSDMFTKNGKNPLDSLLDFRVKDGGFSHTKGTGYNAMATEQAIQALEAYKMFKENLGSIYEFK